MKFLSSLSLLWWVAMGKSDHELVKSRCLHMSNIEHRDTCLGPVDSLTDYPHQSPNTVIPDSIQVPAMTDTDTTAQSNVSSNIGTDCDLKSSEGVSDTLP